MTKKARAVVENAVEQITVKYEITEKNSGLPKVYSSQADYEEIIVMEAKLYRKLDKKILYNVSSYIFQTITYPMLLVLNVENKEYQLYTFSFHKPIRSQYNSVIDKRFATFWFSINNMRDCDEAFLTEFVKTIDISKANSIRDLFEKMCSVLPLHRKLVRELIEEKRQAYYVSQYDDNTAIKREIEEVRRYETLFRRSYSTKEDGREAYCEDVAKRRFSDPNGRVDYSAYIAYYGGYEYDDDE